MDLQLDVNTDRIARRLGAAAKQIQFGSVMAATELARRVQAAETEALPEVFDDPTPFTMKAFAISAARKSDPIAEVFAKQTQAKYLAPSEDGGEQYLGMARSIRVPVDIRTNKYGNIPRGAISRYLPAGARSTPGPGGYFIGEVKGIVGLWKRSDTKAGARRKGKRRGVGPYGTKGQVFDNGGMRSTLELLIRFDRPKPVKAQLHFHDRARQVIHANAAEVVGSMIRKALDTAK